jgi:7,8-dihydro-6-hydroxymethylpterin-pyrophosphokinase
MAGFSDLICTTSRSAIEKSHIFSGQSDQESYRQLDIDILLCGDIASY